MGRLRGGGERPPEMGEVPRPAVGVGRLRLVHDAGLGPPVTSLPSPGWPVGPAAAADAAIATDAR
eukprot:8966791-Pyramimonas_sp.AAC.1